MTLRPKQGVGPAPVGAARQPRTYEFASYQDGPNALAVTAEVERLLVRSGSSRDSAEAVLCLRRAAALLTDGDERGAASDPERAFLILSMAFRRAPDDLEVVAALDRLAER